MPIWTNQAQDHHAITSNGANMQQAYNKHAMRDLATMGQPSSLPKTVAKHAQNGDQNAIQIMQINEPKLKASKRVSFHHYRGHSWHELGHQKQSISMQNDTQIPSHGSPKMHQVCKHTQCQFLDIQEHTLKAWNRLHMHTYKHDLWTEIRSQMMPNHEGDQCRTY